MLNLDFDLDSKISVMVNMPDGVKLSEPINQPSIHDDRQGGSEFSFYS